MGRGWKLRAAGCGLRAAWTCSRVVIANHEPFTRSTQHAAVSSSFHTLAQRADRLEGVADERAVGDDDARLPAHAGEQRAAAPVDADGAVVEGDEGAELVGVG